MLNNSFGKDDEENFKNQNTLYSRQKNKHNKFDTYPPHKKIIKKVKLQQQRHNCSDFKKTSQQSTSNIKMSSCNSPLRNTNSRRFSAKRSVKSNLSDSSTEKLPRHTSGDSTTSQEDDELIMNTSEKRKMMRRNLNNGFQNHKYQHHLIQHRNPYTSQSLGCDEDNCLTIFGKHSQYVSDMIDIGIRVVLVVVFSKLETQTVFNRVIHTKEMWRYKNPRTKDFVSPLALLISVILGPFSITLIHLALTKDRRDFRAASWAWTLILGLNGLFTSLLKISVGRPRPDFYYRCFPDGAMKLSHNDSSAADVLDLFNCTGNSQDINEGLKSFPSGHSSFAFAAFGFITYYVGAKLHAFNQRGRGESWRLCVSITPLVLAFIVAISRTCDYHHHWEDVTVGGFIGLFVSYFIYRQYYPSIFSPHCNRAYPRGRPSTLKAKDEHTMPNRHAKRLYSYKRLPSEECADASLLCENLVDGFSANNDRGP